MSKNIKQIEIATYDGIQTLSLGRNLINTTYAELKELRNANLLEEGAYYRITDFVTTVANDSNTRSANHPFDIIVLATSTNTLQEEAFAALHEGDEYFKDCKLEAWKLWYCLNNDNTRFAWADTTNGKGVIYRLIDEWNNDCPYDFKNIQFKRCRVTSTKIPDLNNTYVGIPGVGLLDLTNVETDTIWCYTFSRRKYDSSSNSFAWGIEADASLYSTNDYDLYSYYDGLTCTENKISTYSVGKKENAKFHLNNIVFIDGFLNSGPPAAGYKTVGNSFGVDCYNNTFLGWCTYNTFGNGCCRNTFGSNCYYNTFGNNCYSNSFGGGCRTNMFGNTCAYNSFGNDCYSNSFGNNCAYNSFGNNCAYNSFGNYCDDNSFGIYFQYNSFGGDCGGNLFGNYGQHNSFGNNCDNNSFGSNCSSNSFGNNCDNNSFGNNCAYNSFGNNCGGNSFGIYFRNNTIGNDVCYINVPTDNIQHTNILNGTRGVSINNKRTIPFEVYKSYSQFAGFDSDGNLQVWVDADLSTVGNIINVTYAELKSLKDRSKLKPSTWYRITDFVTTAKISASYQSANHPFDLIVFATSSNTLQEKCFAALHEGDEYFKNSKLNVWQVWYCLDNDTQRFDWATSDGKGVIYRMIDEWNNDCPYDFKNIQFKRYRATSSVFNNWVGDGDEYFATSSYTPFKCTRDTSVSAWCYTFDKYQVYINAGDFAKVWGDGSLDGRARNITICEWQERNGIIRRYLNDIVFFVNHNGTATRNCKIADDCHDMTFGETSGDVHISERCYNITAAVLNPCITLKRECYNITLGGNCQNVELNKSCHDIALNHNSSTIKMGDGCNNIVTYGDTDGSKFLTFGACCENIELGGLTQGITFGDWCSHIYGKELLRGTIGTGCHYIYFGSLTDYTTPDNTYDDLRHRSISAFTIDNGVMGLALNPTKDNYAIGKLVVFAHVHGGVYGGKRISSFGTSASLEISAENPITEVSWDESDNVGEINFGVAKDGSVIKWTNDEIDGGTY